MFPASWEALGRTALLALGVYAFLIAALRVAGARALAKTSAYDLVVTIALGSLIATIPLQRQVSAAEGIAVIAIFLVLQRLMSRGTTRWTAFRRAAKNPAVLAVYQGRLLRDRMIEADLNEDEVYAAVRSAGVGSVVACAAVVLENDGTWSVIREGSEADLSALRGVSGFDGGQGQGAPPEPRPRG